MTHSTHCQLDPTRRKLQSGGVADLNSARQAAVANYRWGGMLHVAAVELAWWWVARASGVGARRVTVDMGAQRSKEGAMRPSVNIRHSLVEARVT